MSQLVAFFAPQPAFYLRLSLLVSLLWGATACASSPYHVTQPLPQPLGDSSLSLQVSAKKSAIGIVSPRRRYANKMLPMLHNRLLEAGFVLKKEQADLHLHVQVEEITTGATNDRSECELLVELYDSWPGKLTLGDTPRAAPSKKSPTFSMQVRVQKRARLNGYPREKLAEDTAKQCVSDVVSYLKKHRE